MSRRKVIHESQNNFDRRLIQGAPYRNFDAVGQNCRMRKAVIFVVGDIQDAIMDLMHELHLQFVPLRLSFKYDVQVVTIGGVMRVPKFRQIGIHTDNLILSIALSELFVPLVGLRKLHRNVPLDLFARLIPHTVDAIVF